MSPNLSRITIFMLALSLLGSADSAQSDTRTEAHFGVPPTLTIPTPLADVLSDPDQFADEKILLQGRLSEICQKKGCWTILREGEAFLRVRFTDYGFFLPRELQGRKAVVEGVVSVRTLSEEEARHYASDARKARTGPSEAIVGPQREVGFVADGVTVLPLE